MSGDLSALVAAWMLAQAEAACTGLPADVERAEEARRALAAHPAAQHARRTHAPNVTGVRDGVEP